MLDWERMAGQYKERAELAEEQVRQLRDILRPKVRCPSEWKLTPAQSRMLAVLALRGEVTKAAMHEASTRNAGIQTEPNTVAVQIVRMRAKLTPFGIKIGTTWGIGYYLPDKSREIVNAALRVVDGDEKKEISRGDGLPTEGTTA